MLAWALLLLSSAIVAYTLGGYPLFLALRRNRTAPAVRKDPNFTATVSLILAVHNGGPFLRAKIESILALDYPSALLEILVVSDGSSDDTDRIAEQFADRGIRLIRLPRGGKAAALNAGLAATSSELVFFTDVRQLLDRDSLRHLVANFNDPTIGAATGELQLLRAGDGRAADLDLYWRYELWARRRHSQIDSMFNTTGCIYVVRRALIVSIPPDTLIDDAVIPLQTFRKGYRIISDPAAIAFDDPSLFDAGFYRRLRTLGGLWQTYVRLPWLLGGGNRMWVHFTSHKFARLVLPWALLGGAAATIALPESRWRILLLIAEGTLLLLAVVDYLLPARFPLKRLSAAARGFLVVNLAALCSVVVFVVPPAKLWGTPVRTP